MSYYRLMAGLPALPEQAEGAPIPLAEVLREMLEELEENERDRALVLALLGQIDCRNVESVLRGFELFDERGLLSRQAIEERSQLPEYIEEFIERYHSGSLSELHPFDALWRAYFQQLSELAQSAGNAFLRDWVAFELGLLDGLVRLRAEELGEKAELRSTGLEDEASDEHQALLASLAETSSPMERERLLDSARLRAIESFSGTDPFSVDAVLAYLVASLILDRWDLSKNADAAKILEVFA